MCVRVRACVCESIVNIVTGGTREGLYGDENYLVMWGNRRGFAKLALQAQVVCCFSPILSCNTGAH